MEHEALWVDATGVEGRQAAAKVVAGHIEVFHNLKGLSGTVPEDLPKVAIIVNWNLRCFLTPL